MAKTAPSIKFTLGSLKPFLQEFEKFDKNKYEFLKYIGGRSRMMLWGKYLRGQLLFYRGLKDSAGRRTVAYRVAKRNTSVTIKSYPLNIWERPHKLRGGGTIKGVGALKKLKKDLDGSRLANWSERFIQNIFDKEQ